MKKSLTMFSLLAGAVGVYAQGQIHFDDYFTVAGDAFTITVWAPQGDGTTQVFGNSAGDSPVGNQVYGGVALGGGTTFTGPTGYGTGANYSVALYAAPGASVAYSSLVAVPGAETTFSTTFPGQWDTGGNVIVTVPNVAAGAAGTFALAAWYNGGGTLTLAQASVAGSGDPYGWSQEANLTLSATISPPGSLNPITSFSLLSNTTVPEPSTVALGVIGASAFLMRLRRK